MNRNLMIGGVVLLLLSILGGYWVINRSQSTPTPNTQDLEVKQPDATASSEATNVKEFTVESTGQRFSPTEIRVSLGDTVRVTYKNNQGSHDWNLDEFSAKTGLIDAGDRATVEFIANKVGSFEYYCSVPGHRQAGMKGTLIVE